MSVRRFGVGWLRVDPADKPNLTRADRWRARGYGLAAGGVAGGVLTLWAWLT